MKYKLALTILFLSFSLSACLPTTDDPKSVADKYWENLQSGNLKEAEKLISKKNEQTFLQHSNHIVADSKLQNQKAKTTVSTTITTTTNPTTNQVHQQTFDTVLILKDGQWKIDLEQTKIPPPPTNYEQELEQLSENINESMQENIESIDESIQQGMQIFNEALRDGSKEMGDSLILMMNKLNTSMKDSIEKMKQRREQQLKEDEHQQTQPNSNKGEGMI